MFRCACILALLLIFACDGDAKYRNYGRVLASLEYNKILSLLAPEKMLTHYNNTLAVYADDEAWLSSSCRSNLITFNDAIARRETWALMMLDASSKLPSGILRGNVFDMGLYDECSNVHSNFSGSDIRGLHCQYSISVSQGTVTLPTNPTLSICLPATCSAGDIVSFFNATLFSWIDKLKDLEIKIVSASCSSICKRQWDLEFVAWLIILAIYVTFLIACTAIEMSSHLKKLDVGHSRLPLVDTLAMFSLRKSAASILNMEMKMGTLPAIDGIRCFSMAVIVLLHQNAFTSSAVIINTLDYIEWNRSWKSWYISLAPLSVDTFFALSGFLMTYLFLKRMPKQKRFNIPMYYLHRYLRMTPAVLALMIFSLVFIPKFGSGSHWEGEMNTFFINCRAKWWAILLYLQNVVDSENRCLGHLWYLAVEMQFFLISPLILYPLYKKPKFGSVLLAALLFSCMAIQALVIGIKKLPVISNDSNNATVIMDICTHTHLKPYSRAGAWLVGIFLGYEVAMHDRRLNRWTEAAGWLMTIASFAFCLFVQRIFRDPDYVYNVVWESFFSAVYRPIWAFGVCWIIYASIKHQAGLVSSILSSRIFLPLSRLSYCIYLVHYLILRFHNSGLKTPVYYSEYYLWHSFFTTLVISIPVAFLFSIFFESPIMVLEKILKRKPESQSKKRHEKILKPSEYESSEPAIKISNLNDHFLTSRDIKCDQEDEM